MVKRTLLWLSLFALAGGAFALSTDEERKYDSSDVYRADFLGYTCTFDAHTIRLYQNTVPKIKTVIVGERREGIIGDQFKDACFSFVKSVTDEDIKKFFTEAHETSVFQSFDLTIPSSCNARGTIVFENGEKAKWWVDAWGKGAIKLDNGLSGVFFCPTCPSPFAYQGLIMEDWEDYKKCQNLAKTKNDKLKSKTKRGK